MRKKLNVFLTFVCTCNLFLPGFGMHYSNLIIFGDSQSDIGNMPEAANLNLKAQAPYDDDSIPYNLYIPP